MGYYAIGIGGTGAKCLESVIHLAAAGMMPDGDKLYILFVDPDNANGSLERAVETLDHYKTFSNNPQLEQPCLLQTEIISASNPIFAPFDIGDGTKPRLSVHFNFAGLKMGNHNAAHLFEVLYSEKERETELDKGFRGHPSIGASVMAQTVLGNAEPWKTFRGLVNADSNPKIFLAGSIFGGTGASGFPTIAKLIKNELKTVKVKTQIGGALLLPYFTFTADADEELKAKAEHFLMNTQAALKYYHLWNKDLIYDAIYLFGDDSQIEVENALGGKTQRNAQHFIELYAALAAIDFFGRDFGPDGNAQYFRIDRSSKQLQWTDLPDDDNGKTVRSRIGQMARFAFAYLSIYQPMLEDIRKKNRPGYNAPWYIDFFDRNPKIPLNDDTKTSLEAVQHYCQDFLFWLANIQNSVGDARLVKHDAYTQKTDGNRLKFIEPFGNFDLKKFGNLISPDTSESLHSVNRLWENMCLAKGKGDGTGIGKFLSTLYQNCGNI